MDGHRVLNGLLDRQIDRQTDFQPGKKCEFLQVVLAHPTLHETQKAVICFPYSESPRAKGDFGYLPCYMWVYRTVFLSIKPEVEELCLHLEIFEEKLDRGTYSLLQLKICIKTGQNVPDKSNRNATTNFFFKY